MKAIVQDRYGSADVLEFRDIEEPVVGENDVLVRVHAAGCGPDVWHIMAGEPYMARIALGLRSRRSPSVAGTSPGPSRLSERTSRTSGSATRSWEPPSGARSPSSWPPRRTRWFRSLPASASSRPPPSRSPA